MSLAAGLSAALVLVLANAFFVAAEFAFVAVDRTRLELLAEKGSRPARVSLSLLGKLSFNLSGAQLGITITSLALGLLTEPVFAAALEPLLAGVVGEARPSAMRRRKVAVGLGCRAKAATSQGWSQSRPIPGNGSTSGESPACLAAATCGRKLSRPKAKGMASGGATRMALVPRRS